ncbi:hypothetical protein [Thauera humireducens]
MMKSTDTVRGQGRAGTPRVAAAVGVGAGTEERVERLADLTWT